jgi:hypothetical protein
VHPERSYFVNGIVLGALAIMWITVLSWEGIQGLRGGMGHRGDSMSRFRRQLDIMSNQPYQMSAANRLEFDAGGVRLRRSPRYTPSSRFEAARRRRDIVLGLGLLAAAAIGGFYLARTPSSLWVMAIAATSLVGYCALVVRRRQIVAEQAAKVRYLPTAVSTSASGSYDRQAN